MMTGRYDRNRFKLTPPPLDHERGGKHAYWPTPRWVTEALLDVHPPPTPLVLEPSAGSGAIAEVLLERGYKVTAVEKRAECEPGLVKMGCDPVTICDWVTTVWPESAAELSIVANPPYNPSFDMLRHVEHMLGFRAAYIAALLPCAFFHSRERFAFHQRHPVTGYYPIAERPSFGGGTGQRDVAWFVWDCSTTATFIKVLTKRR